MWRRILSVRNIYTAIVVRLLIMVMLFSVCRLLFFAFNYGYFSGITPTEWFITILAGIRFDAAVIITLNGVLLALYLLPVPFRTRRIYQGFTDGLYYVVNIACLLANCIDFAYFRFTLKRTTADIFDFLTIGNGGDFFSLLPAYIRDYWYIILIWLVLTFLLIFLYKKTKKGYYPTGNKVVYYLKGVLYLLIGGLLWVYIGRGGFQLRPLNIISAGEYASAQNIPLVLNTPFTIFRTIGSGQITVKEYFRSQKELDAIFNPYHHNNPADSMKKMNVVIIILESFSKEHMGYVNRDLENEDYKGFTPFLDSLSQQGMNFTHAFANGKKSIEGIPSVMASLPNLMDKPFITSGYAGNPIDGLPSMLKKYGYSSAFFHGGTNGTMQFDAFASMAGFDEYVGRTEYNNEKDFDGNWGIFDEEFLQFTAKKIQKMKEPFVVSIFTLSSHHPYKIPDKYKGIFPKGKFDIHESIGYADYSLKKFFETASKMPWFNNTLFVITADHSSPTFSEYYQNCVGNLAIPMVYYRADGSLKSQNPTVTEQTDIMPSVLDYLNYHGDYIAYGESVFDSTSKHYSICYFNNVYQLISGDLMLQFNGEKTLAVYDLVEDPLLKNNLVNKPVALFSRQEKLVKAIIQSYNERMSENKLTTDHE
jgi:phosphoglycerol transferase MdoB-like AlkP superfamily enzyme